MVLVYWMDSSVELSVSFVVPHQFVSVGFGACARAGSTSTLRLHLLVFIPRMYVCGSTQVHEEGVGVCSAVEKNKNCMPS